MSKTTMKFECPKCHTGARALLEESYKFLIYKCPNCHSNVAFYNNKLTVISDRMISLLRKKKKIKLCRTGMTVEESAPPKIPVKVKPLECTDYITKDHILDLKILLETEKDLDSLISKL
jgi:hypothetical protein